MIGDNPEHLSGVATEDPLSQIRRPFALRITSKCFLLEQLDGPHGITSFGAFHGTALSVSFRDDENHHTIGSAVVVGPGIAISAKHVVEDWLVTITSGQASVVCQGPTPTTVQLWDVEKVTLLDTADLAILCIKLRSAMPENNELYTTHLTTRMPTIGDRVLLCGFTAAQPAIPRGSEIRLDGLMRICHGEVIEVWPQGRDRVMLPSASFAVNCPAFGGMSGGAVFDANGHLIGIVSSSSEGDEIAYVTHILPALVASIEPTWPRPIPSSTLLHLGQRNCISIHRPDAFRLEVADGKVELRYVPWS